MDPVIASLMGTVIGGVFGIAGGILTGQRQARLEQEKWLQARKDDIEKETRLAVAELTRKMAVAMQAMLWFTSMAESFPKKFSHEDISEYDMAIKELLPDILSSFMVVSALDTDVSDKMTPLLYKIYIVDGQITQASTQFETSPQASLKSLAELRSIEVLPLYGELAQTISGITGLTNLVNNRAEGLTPNR
jgi:hypothetical protein